MKTFLRSAAIRSFGLLSMPILIVGCSHSSIYLQDYQVKSPIPQPPVFLATDTVDRAPFVTFSVHAYSPDKVKGYVGQHTQVDANGVFRVDTGSVNGRSTLIELPGNGLSFSGNNMTWTIPGYALSFSFGQNFGRRMSYAFLVDYASQGNDQFYAIGFDLGCTLSRQGIATRFDASVLLNNHKYAAQFAQLVSNWNTNTEVAFFQKSGTSRVVDWNVSFTMNTLSSTLPFDIFLQLGYGRHSLASVEVTAPLPYATSGHTTDLDVSASVLSIAPGVSVSLGSFGSLLCGVRLMQFANIGESASDVTVSPFVQYGLPIR